MSLTLLAIEKQYVQRTVHCAIFQSNRDLAHIHDGCQTCQCTDNQNDCKSSSGFVRPEFPEHCFPSFLRRVDVFSPSHYSFNKFLNVICYLIRPITDNKSTNRLSGGASCLKFESGNFFLTVAAA